MRSGGCLTPSSTSENSGFTEWWRGLLINGTLFILNELKGFPHNTNASFTSPKDIPCHVGSQHGFIQVDKSFCWNKAPRGGRFVNGSSHPYCRNSLVQYACMLSSLMQLLLPSILNGCRQEPKQHNTTVQNASRPSS